jgi:hypothetical protein
MANNRMYLECADPGCDEEQRQILLAKTFGGGYQGLYHDAEKIDAFFEMHRICSLRNENCFRISYELTEPNTMRAAMARDAAKRHEE